MSEYKAKQGDVIWVDLSPTLGHEQKGRRPALVLWNDKVAALIPGLSLVVPISTTDNGFPLHIKLDASSPVRGFALCEYCKTIDLSSRNAEYAGRVSEKTLATVIEVVIATIKNN